jgi:hypothetical protein
LRLAKALECVIEQPDIDEIGPRVAPYSFLPAPVQQSELSEQQPPLAPSLPRMMPAAQPTPALTRIASTGQFRAHAPHSMQASRSATRAVPSSTENTACGQTAVHIPQPMHLPTSRSSVVTPDKYLSIFALLLAPAVR